MNRKKNSWLSPQLLGIFFVILALILMLLFVPNETRNPSSTLTKIIHKPVAAIQSIRNWFKHTIKNISDNLHAKAELDMLREKFEKVQKENVELRYKLRRHEAYRVAQKLQPEEKFATEPAIVCFRDNRMVNTMIINKGTEAGLTVNLAVMTNSGLVGRTYRLTPHAARVQLIKDPASAIPVYIEGTTFEGILRGTEEGDYLLITDQYLLDMGDETRTPEPGQAVFTSGTGNVFERDLLTGYIADATSEEGLLVSPAVDFKDVQSVYVILNTPLQKEILSLLSED